MANEAKPEASFMRRHWTGTPFTADALFVPADSLRAGIRTEGVNE